MDANVLIDLCEADRTIIRLVSDHISRVHVPLPVLREEVDQIDEAECADLGIVPIEPSLETAMAAATRRAGLSFHDHLCVLLARDTAGPVSPTTDVCGGSVRPRRFPCSGGSRRWRSSWTAGP